MILGVELDKSKEVFSFIESTKEKAESPMAFFISGFSVRFYTRDESIILLLSLLPLVPFNMLMVGGIGFLLTLYFAGLTYWLSIWVFLGATQFFISKYFVYLIVKSGLKKSGYIGSCNLLSNEQIIRRIERI